MIAEDNLIIQELIAMCLRDTCELTLVSNGAEGWQWIQDNPPDALITDLMMPGDMDGNALIRAVKNHSIFKNIPVLVISARAQQADMELSLRLGADGYMTKPFSPSKLIRWVGEMVRPR